MTSLKITEECSDAEDYLSDSSDLEDIKMWNYDRMCAMEMELKYLNKDINKRRTK